MIFGLPVALYRAFVLDVLHESPVVLVRRQGLVTIVACVCWGAAIVGFGFAASLWAALLFLMLGSAADMVSGLYRDAILKTLTPDEMRGRLEGIGLAVVGTGPSLGNAEAGLLAAVTSVRFSVVSGGSPA